ncbi:aldo/keto reductase [Intestinimonas butyriciproducens]|nr:aldo/keto reductase [Intestinimonas butyriciproducens]
MRLPKIDPEKSDIDKEKAQEMIDYAYSHGINYFDTAYPYHEGKSELFVGEAMKKYPRESFHLASKMPVWLVEKPEDTLKYFEEQLNKCQVEYFDYYLCHALNHDRLEIIKKNHIFETLQKEKEAGRIKHLGFSFHGTIEMLEEIVNAYDWDFAQIQLNYYDWDMQNAKRQYEILEEHGLPVVVMEPVRGGALHTLCPEGIEMLKKADPNATPASWALRFAASLPNVLVVLSGMTTMEHMQDNVATVDDFKPLTESERELLFKVADVYKQSKTVPCTGCRYCMDCPAGVDIPAVFKIYNQYCVTENKAQFLADYEALGDSKQAHHCVACRQCCSQCPQSIDIPTRMEDVKALYKKLKG